MTDFFLFARLNLGNILISTGKKNSIAIFLPRVLMCQKRQISLPVGYKTATPNTGDWERLRRQFRTPLAFEQASRITDLSVIFLL